MAGNDPWAAFNPQPAPQAPSGFRGGQVLTQPQPDPIKQATEARAEQDQVLQQAAAGRDATRFNQQQLEWNATHNPDGTAKDPMANAIPANLAGVTGDAFLKALPANDQAQVKALAEGRMQFPQGRAATSPYWQTKIAQVSQYDPSFDAINYNARAATRRDFTSGTSSRNIKALNTAIGHVAQLADQIDGTASHGGFPGATTVNAVENALYRSAGSSGITNYAQTAGAVAGELTQVFRGTGGAEADIQRYLSELDPNASRDQKKAAVANILTLLKSRLDALNDQYGKGMGTASAGLDVLDDHSKQSLAKYLPGFDAGQYGSGPPPLGPSGGGNTPSGGPPPTPFDSNPGGDQTVASGATRSVFEPAVAAGLNALVQHDRPYEEAAAFAQQHGYPAPNPQEYAAAIAWQHAHPNSPYDAANPTRTVPTTTLEQVAGSPLGAAGIAAGDAASAFTLDNAIGALGGNADQARQAIDASGQNSPVASTLGTLGGGILASLGGEAALGRAGMEATPIRALLADTGYGAAAGAGGTDSGDRLAGAVKGAVAGAGGSIIGSKVGNALARLGQGVANPAVNALRSEGVDNLTIGQTFGQSGRLGAAVKGIEDRLSGLPVVGDLVKARQTDSFRQFNTKAFDKALEPIGETVAGQTGEQAIQTAQDKVSQAFTNALAGKGAHADEVFVRDLGTSVSHIDRLKRVGPELKDSVAEIFQPYADEPLLSGEALDDISRRLRTLKGGYVQDPQYPRIAKAIDDVERSVFDLFDRQASGTIPDYMKARQAYRRVSILQDAVLKARNQNERLFTPAELGQADRSNANKFGGKRTSAAGQTPFFDYQTAGQAVLPNKVPDSGTVGRLLVPLTLIGGGETADRLGAGGTGLTLGTILALAYSKAGQRLLTRPGRGISNDAIRRVLESDKTRRAIAAGGAATGASIATQ